MLGAVRDLDVFATETLRDIAKSVGDVAAKSAALRALARRIAVSRGVARRAARAAIASPRYTRLVLAVSALIETLGSRDAAQSAREAARTLLARRHRTLERLAAHLEGASADERHAVRIAAKKLRYAAEFFAPLAKRKRVRRYLGALAALQQVLGRANDEIVAARHADESGVAEAAAIVRAYAAANATTHASALRRTWKRFERSKPYWHGA
jgi:CHAD domain-containing protein